MVNENPIIMVLRLIELPIRLQMQKLIEIFQLNNFGIFKNLLARSKIGNLIIMALGFRTYP